MQRSNNTNSNILKLQTSESGVHTTCTKYKNTNAKCKRISYKKIK